ncbi:pyridoxamine 5'-phosphate oxidase family protein [Haloarcula nitratireducens]|uniref:Pyridoxamine 5'-phosphate oxidase family protein n=1 Tax=Haloarcula nitratireducens TaxID=2487749 RepID=A0AAW4PE70_9EURY|nr:pyridoxamine 5'-phosphate oxidase family protein [Halomicroarcula nitratireducens]MBX0296123.1 pyridoxamine 5'-phosphate oxidase family protein [Halomicroarcula nitratireducens]
MEDARSVQMSTEARNEFLGTGGTGVISFDSANGGPPYTRPISYGYDADTGNFYFRLAVGPEDAGKKELIGEDGEISFVTYEETGSGWRSVIATGSLDEVTKSALDPEVAEAMQRIRIPFVDVYDSHPLTLEFRFFRLTPNEITGQQEAGTGE